MDPATRLRDGIHPARCVEVAIADGTILLIGPCLIAAADVLQGKLSDYQIATLELRNAWRKASLLNKNMDPQMRLFSIVALGAIMESYAATPDEIGAWMETGNRAEAVVKICAVACGHTTPLLQDQRKRALNIAALGMANIPLSPDELAYFSDFAEAIGRSPKVH